MFFVICEALTPPGFAVSYFFPEEGECKSNEQLGAIKGMTGSLAVFSSAAGPVIAGLLLEAGVGFPAMLTGFAIALGLASVSAVIGRRQSSDARG